MTSFRPTKVEQFAIEAKLNRFFGENVYDRLFLGFEVVEVVDDSGAMFRRRPGTQPVFDNFDDLKTEEQPVVDIFSEKAIELRFNGELFDFRRAEGDRKNV